MKKSLHRILLCLRPNHPGLLIHLKSTFSEKIKDALLPYEQQGIRSLQSEQAGMGQGLPSNTFRAKGRGVGLGLSSEAFLQLGTALKRNL